MFPSRFDGRCELEGCHQITYEDITEMMGVEVFSPETQDFERKSNDKPYWICANHYMVEDENNPNQEEDLEEIEDADDIIEDENNPNQEEELNEEILVEEEEEEEMEEMEDAEEVDEEWNEVNGYYRDVTEIFLAIFDGQCQLEGCGEDIHAFLTEIIGVEVYSNETHDFERKHDDKPYWICASHVLDEGTDDESTNDEEEE